MVISDTFYLYIYIKMKMFKTGILGGSFDPPTLAHALMAAELLNKHIVDKVVFVPCGARDDKVLTSGEHRLKMLKLMIDHVFPPTNSIEINDIEIKNGRMIPTYHMLKKISKEYENIEFVIGSDLVETLSDWDEGEKLRNEMHFIILNRDTNSIPTIRDHHFPEKYTLIP